MNTIIFYGVVVLVLSAIAWCLLACFWANRHENKWPLYPSGVMAIFAILIFVLTIGLYYEPIKIEVRQASTIRTFDQIAVKAADWPEIMTTDVNVLEKPIQIRKTVSSDPWGYLKTEYAVEVIPVEISE